MLSLAADLKLTGQTGFLRCCQLFAGLPADDLAAIAGFSLTLSLAKGDYLFHEGEPSRGFYAVQSGAINVHRVSAAGREQVVHVFRAGDTFAEAALAAPTGYPADARALEPSTVLLIPKGPILELLARRPELGLRMLGSMSTHLRVLVGALEDLTLRDVETRLLNWLARRLGKSPGGLVQLPGTKRALAAELGASSETLSRTLARLRNLGLVAVKGRTLVVADPGALLTRLRRNLGES